MKKLTRYGAVIRLLEKWGEYDDCDLIGANTWYFCKSLLSDRQRTILKRREGVKIMISRDNTKNAVVVSF